MPRPSVQRVPEGVYGGVPAEQRRAERRARLMEAALELMGTEGWSATTVRGVCQRAQLTARFFYESFADIDELAVAVFDQAVGEMTVRVLAAIDAAPEDPSLRARAAIETMVGVLTEDPRKARVAFVEALGNEAMTKRRQQTMRTLADLIAAEARRTYGSAPEADRFVELTSIVLAGGLSELMIVWLAGDLEMTREQLVDDCGELLAATGEQAAAIATARSRARPLLHS